VTTPRFLPFSLGYAIFHVMKKILSVDQAGRLVLPKELRDQFGLHPGSQLELAIGPDHVELKPVQTTASLRQNKKLWVHHGRAQTSLIQAVAALRDERLRAIGGGVR
jgi:AbrB family looped-hinge helix DNA binding protein